MTWRNLIQATGLWRGGEVKAESRRSCSRAVRLSLGCGPGSSAHLILRTQMLLPRMFPVSQHRIFHMFSQQRQHYQNISNFWRLAASWGTFQSTSVLCWVFSSGTGTRRRPALLWGCCRVPAQHNWSRVNYLQWIRHLTNSASFFASRIPSSRTPFCLK